MNIAPDKARDIFARATALQKMILDAQDDLKQLRADELEALIDDGMDKDRKKAVRADLSEIIALAKVQAQDDIARVKLAKKMEHRREVAAVVGMQLDMLAPQQAPVARVSAAMKRNIETVFGKKDGVKVELRTGDGELIARGDGKGNVSTEEEKPATPPSVAAVIGRFGALSPVAPMGAAGPHISTSNRPVDDMPDIPPMLDRRPKAPAEAQQSGG